MSLTLLLPSFTHSRKRWKDILFPWGKSSRIYFPYWNFLHLPVSFCLTSGIISWSFSKTDYFLWWTSRSIKTANDNKKCQFSLKQKTWELDFLSESLIWPKIIILKRWGLEFISSLRIKAKYLFFYHLFLTLYFYPPRFSHSLGLFPLKVFLSSSYQEVSKPLFLLSESKVITVGIPSDIHFLVTIIFFFFLAEPTTHLNCSVDSDISPCCPWLPAHHLPLACVTTISKCSNPCI